VVGQVLTPERVEPFVRKYMDKAKVEPRGALEYKIVHWEPKL
jgi:hypothetical protein